MSQTAPERSNTRLKPIQIDWSEGDRDVVVTPKDQDRFVITCQLAATALRQAHRQMEWAEDFKRTLALLHEKISSVASKVSACYVGLGDAQLVAFVVPKKASFDFDLSTQLAKWDRELTRDSKVGPWSILQVPAVKQETLASFLDPGSAIKIYG